MSARDRLDLKLAARIQEALPEAASKLAQLKRDGEKGMQSLETIVRLAEIAAGRLMLAVTKVAVTKERAE
jgi:hypothetical protein